MGIAFSTIQNHRGLSTDWLYANPVLSAGEIGVETDTNKMKIGNGVSTWIELAYSPTLSEPLTAINIYSTTLTTTTITGITTVVTTNLTATSISSTDILASSMTATDITFGTYIASAGLIIGGYMIITDTGGEQRKLAIIS